MPNELDAKFWRACDILRRDDNTQSLLDYVEQISWLLFLKSHEDQEDTRADEAEYAGQPPYERVIAGYFRGANVHQDQAGWGDAVTNGAIERDVRMIKDAGFDFIRGSHYPHDPHFAEATDRFGMLFLPEAPFWGTASFKHPWGAPAYPTEVADRPAFDAGIKQQLAEMIRINRNHPSIIAWSNSAQGPGSFICAGISAFHGESARAGSWANL